MINSREIKLLASKLSADRWELSSEIEMVLTFLLADAALKGGRLNHSGKPLELAFTSGDPTIRYTVEVATQTRSPRDRITTASQYLKQLGHLVPQLDQLVKIQTSGDLDWGAWIGVRHGNGRPVRFKLYTELPANSEQQLRRLGFSIPTGLHPKALGIDLENGREEVYFQSSRPGLPIYRLANWLNHFHMNGLETAIWSAIHDLRKAAGHLTGAVPEISFGLSYSRGSNGQPIFSLFTYPDQLIGSDRTIFNILSHHYRDGLPLYRQIGNQIKPGNRASPLHNAIGWIATPGQPVAVHTALSVPPL